MTARVLIVDDLRPNIKMLEARLLAEYFEVVSATNGQEALTLCREGKCDIVLLDVMMPGMDGFEVCRRLKESPQLSQVPVIFLSAQHDTDDKVRGFALGAVDFIAKPFQAEEILARSRG